MPTPRNTCLGCGIPIDKRATHCRSCFGKARSERSGNRTETEKRCSGCGELQPIGEFFANRARHDGLSVLCRTCHTKTTSAIWQRLRGAVIEKYGGKCVRCGFSDPRAMQLDHINGGGSRDYHTDPAGIRGAYRRALREDTGEFQLLCANCNSIKRVENGEHSGADYSPRRARQLTA